VESAHAATLQAKSNVMNVRMMISCTETGCECQLKTCVIMLILMAKCRYHCNEFHHLARKLECDPLPVWRLAKQALEGLAMDAETARGFAQVPASVGEHAHRVLERGASERRRPFVVVRTRLVADAFEAFQQLGREKRFRQN
jgi:hypothetical protein